MAENTPEKKPQHTMEFNGELNKLRLESELFADGSRSVPFISVNRNKIYVPWMDSASTIQYPIQLLRLYLNSVLHHNIINMKSNYLFGNGLTVKDKDKTDPELVKRTEDFINRRNGVGDDFQDVIQKVITDYVLFNWMNIELRFNKIDGELLEARHIESHKLRIETPNEKGDINGVWWNFNWDAYTRKGNMTYLPYFNYNAFKNRTKELKEIINRLNENNDDYQDDLNKYSQLLEEGKTFACHSYKVYKPNEFYYATPSYVAGITEIEADIASSLFGLNSMNNGMDTNFIVTMLGDLNDKETRADALRFIKNYTDSRSKGLPILYFTNDMENAIKVQEIGNSDSIANKYFRINNDIQSKIVMVHGLPSAAMVSIQTAGKLGSTNETEVHQETFNMNYVKPHQRVIERYINDIFAYQDLAPVEFINTNVFNQNEIESKKSGITQENAADETSSVNNNSSAIQNKKI